MRRTAKLRQVELAAVRIAWVGIIASLLVWGHARRAELEMSKADPCAPPAARCAGFPSAGRARLAE